MDDFEYHGTPKAIKILLRVFAVMVPLAVLLYGLHSFGSPYEDDYYPNVAHNSKWVCLEEDIYFIVDRHGDCRGEAVVDGVSVFFEISFGWRGVVYGYELNAASWDDIGRAAKAGKDYLFSGAANCTANCCKLGLPAKDFHLWETEEEVRLTFLRRTLDEDVDFHGPACSICAFERRR